MQQLEPEWHLQIQTGIELIEKQDLMDWRQQSAAFCNLPKYEQQQYCKQIWRIGEERAAAIEKQNTPVQLDKPKSVSERVQEWHQQQLKIK